MMRALALSGQRSAALAQYQTCRRVLVAEFGVEPAAETRALYEEIKAGEQRSRISGVKSPPPPYPPAPLPLPLTPFIGRERELAEISRLLADPTCRLVTLVGPGGMGKTRLALQAAANQQPEFSNGAIFVPLASITGSELIVPALADALGLTLYGPADLQRQLLNYLRDQELLLALDNAEHLLADGQGVTLWREILQHAPGVKLLVTSRQQLNIQGEWVFEIEGLGRHASELFGQSARRARAGFEIGAKDYSLVERICRLVGEMPLAIELAASWVRLLSLTEIAQEIERNLDFLTTSAQDVPERHRSIRAAFDHSWKLLTAEERQGLQRLSVFRGRFRREAAEVVAGVSLGLLSALVSKSLVHPSDARPGRYELHELIRQYAAAKLVDNPEEEASTHERYCCYYTAWLEGQETALKSPNQPASVAEINAEIDNVRAAWSWAVAHIRVREINQSASVLFWYYELRNWFQEGIALFAQAAQSLRGVGNNEATAPLIEGEWIGERKLALGQALAYQSFFCLRYGQHGQARELLRQSLVVLPPLDSGLTHAGQTALSNALTFLGIVMYVTGDYAEGRQLLHECLAMHRALGDRWGMAISLRHVGLASRALGEYAEAYRFLSESLVISRELKNRWSIAFSLNFLSTTAYAQRHYAEARQLLDEGLALSQALEDRYNIAFALNGLGLVNQAQGSAVEAQHFFQESAAIWREIGDQSGLAQTLNNLGDTLLAMGDRFEAQQLFLEALSVAREAQVTPVALEAVLGLAIGRAQEGAIEAALVLLPPILQHPAASQKTKDRAEQLRAEVEAHLTPPQVEAIRAQAQLNPFEAVVTEILRL